MQRLDRSRFEPVVALARPTAEVLAYHRAAGCRVLPWPGIDTFEHTTAAWTRWDDPGSWALAARTVLGWRRSERRTLELVEHVRPDLVHLNSAVLVPSARALHRAGIPFVWHVRETPVERPGRRGAALCRALRDWPAASVFLSELARRLWDGGDRGRVIPESVDPARFTDGDRVAARRAVGIAPDARVVLFLGGSSVLKGIWPLLGALERARAREGRLVCLMPGVRSRPETSAAALARRLLPFLRLGTPVQRMERAMARLGPGCIPLEFTDATEGLLRAADVLVFPALLDHFARPVLEAWAVGRPVVASRLPMLEELVRDGDTGLLVPPDDPVALADAILELVGDPGRAAAMAARGRAQVLARHDLAGNTALQERLYDEVLAGSAGPR